MAVIIGFTVGLLGFGWTDNPLAFLAGLALAGAFEYVGHLFYGTEVGL